MPSKTGENSTKTNEQNNTTDPGAPRGSQPPEPGWWILVKVGLFLAVPTLLLLGLKQFLG